MLQAEWNAVGFDCSIQVMENAGFFSAWAAGNIRVLYQGWFADYPDGDGMLFHYVARDYVKNVEVGNLAPHLQDLDVQG